MGVSDELIKNIIWDISVDYCKSEITTVYKGQGQDLDFDLDLGQGEDLDFDLDFDLDHEFDLELWPWAWSKIKVKVQVIIIIIIILKVFESDFSREEFLESKMFKKWTFEIWNFHGEILKKWNFSDINSI